MSLFVEHNHTVCDFENANSWVILSPVEQSIKRKIETKGIPLKNWDIKIYRGVLTGCNEAFIIDSECRNDILNNCLDEDERKRTDELIRPILKGKDIKRYYCKWNDLWLINIPYGYTDSHRHSIDPEIWFKNNLSSLYLYFKRFLSAGIKTKGKGLIDRTDQGVYWWELRSCAYLEEFSKPKIIFQEMCTTNTFTYDTQKHFCLDTGRIITGKNIKFLLGILNSSLFFFAVKKYYGGGGLGGEGVRMKHTFFLDFPCIPYDSTIEKYVEHIIQGDDVAFYNNELNKYINKAYNLTDEEIRYIQL